MNVLHVTGMPYPTKFGSFEKWLAENCKNCSVNDKVFISYHNNTGDVHKFTDIIYKNNGSLVILKSDEEIIEFCKKEKINNICFHFNYPHSLQLYHALYKNNIKIFVFFHCEHFIYLDNYTNYTILQKIRTLLHRIKFWHMSKYFSKIFGVSNTVTNQYKKAYFLSKKKISTLYLGIHKENLYPKNNSNNTVTIACTAFHSPVKGVDILLEALKIVKERYKNINLLQIGGGSSELNGEDTLKLKEQCTNLHLNESVHWVGITNDVNYYLSLADIYCQPSRTEALPFAIMEAMNNSLPIIATNVGGVSEIVYDGRNGFLVDPNNPLALADALIKLIEDENKRIQMGAESNKILKELNLLQEQSVKKLWSHFE